MSEKNMAQIPYIEHQIRMFKAYKREQRLKAAIIITNALWILVLAIIIAMR